MSVERNYVAVKLPCHPEVRCFVTANLDTVDGLLIPHRNTAVGREVLRVFRQKSKRVSEDRMNTDYDSHIMIGVHREQLIKMGVLITDHSIREMNLQLTAMLKGALYIHLQLCMIADEDFDILQGILNWMKVMEIEETEKNVAAYKRSFVNWRLRKCPELLRTRGKRSRARKWKDEKMFLENFPLNQQRA